MMIIFAELQIKQWLFLQYIGLFIGLFKEREGNTILEGVCIRRGLL